MPRRLVVDQAGRPTPLWVEVGGCRRSVTVTLDPRNGYGHLFGRTLVDLRRYLEDGERPTYRTVREAVEDLESVATGPRRPWYTVEVSGR